MILDAETLVATEMKRRTSAAAAYAQLPTDVRSDKRWRWRRLAWLTHGRPSHA